MPDNDETEIPLVWVGLDEQVAQMANQFLCQFVSEGCFILSVGQVIPPPLLGTPEEVTEQARNLPYITVNPLARFSFTEENLRQLVETIQSNLVRYENRQGGGAR